jgi:hypothetical protein
MRGVVCSQLVLEILLLRLGRLDVVLRHGSIDYAAAYFRPLYWIPSRWSLGFSLPGNSQPWFVSLCDIAVCSLILTSPSFSVMIFILL